MWGITFFKDWEMLNLPEDLPCSLFHFQGNFAQWVKDHNGVILEAWVCPALILWDFSAITFDFLPLNEETEK